MYMSPGIYCWFTICGHNTSYWGSFILPFLLRARHPLKCQFWKNLFWEIVVYVHCFASQYTHYGNIGCGVSSSGIQIYFIALLHFKKYHNFLCICSLLGKTLPIFVLPNLTPQPIMSKHSLAKFFFLQLKIFCFDFF